MAGHDYALQYQAPSHVLRLIEAAISEPNHDRLLYRVRRINEARHSPVTGPAFLRHRGSSPLPYVEISDQEEDTVRHAVVQHVVGMKEDGSVDGGMLKEHVVELMDMMLPVWVAERERE